jgi:hypothetical protein
MKPPDYDFVRQIGRILNSGQSRSVVLTGSVTDLFFSADRGERGSYLTLLEFLTEFWSRVEGRIVVLYEPNQPIRFLQESDEREFSDAWNRWRTGRDADRRANALLLGKPEEEVDHFRVTMRQAHADSATALEILRQMCMCSRMSIDGQPLLRRSLVVLIEDAHMLLPEAEIARLSDADRRRIVTVRDWLTDPAFCRGNDGVVLITESLGQLNSELRLPQLLEVQVPAPDFFARQFCISWYNTRQAPADQPLKLWATQRELAEATAGLSIHALLQLLREAVHLQQTLTLAQVTAKVEAFIRQQMGEDAVEYLRPAHRLRDVVGHHRLKTWLKVTFLPRLHSVEVAFSGATICGPIGGGKTFLFEAVAAEAGMPVLVLKNLRRKWFGETDLLLARLYRLLWVLDKVIIFVDEADTQFGRIGAEDHAVERRLTGTIQQMMSDPRLRGHVYWLLLTARVHLLSPDLRRKGRAGDFIIPVLDPESEEDRLEFVAWAIDRSIVDDPALRTGFLKAIEGYSAADFAALRQELRALTTEIGQTLSMEMILAAIRDILPTELGPVREYQKSQALLACSHRSLWPDPSADDTVREEWRAEIARLESIGVR